MALQPAVATSESGAQETDTFASASHRLLPGGPQLVRHNLGHGAATEGRGLAISGDLDAAQLAHVDGDPVVHLAQRCESPVDAIVGQEGDFLLVGILHLYIVLVSMSS